MSTEWVSIADAIESTNCEYQHSWRGLRVSSNRRHESLRKLDADLRVENRVRSRQTCPVDVMTASRGEIIWVYPTSCFSGGKVLYVNMHVLVSWNHKDDVFKQQC